MDQGSEKTNRLFSLPPFNWFDRPRHSCASLGVKWLANLLYPEEYRIDITREDQEFSAFPGCRSEPQEAKRYATARGYQGVVYMDGFNTLSTL
jgi:hypothetical protein